MAARVVEPAPAEESQRPTRTSARATPVPDPETTLTESTPPKPRGRFASMTIEELQTKYLEVVGRSTGSDDRRYVEPANMGSRAPAGRVLPRRTRRRTPHNRVAFSSGMTLRFPRPEACMATGAASWRSQGERT